MAQSELEISLRLKDEASQGIKSAGQAARKSAESTAAASARAANRAAESTERGVGKRRAAYQRMMDARQRLGVRSERSIQREIQQTEAAYHRLKASGTLSFREQARAADQMKQRVTQLTNEMGKLTAKQKAMGALKIGGALIAGTAAAGYAVKGAAERVVDHNLEMAHLTNDIYSGKSREEKAAGKKELEGIINKAVRETQGGATSGDAITALRELTSRGKMSVEDAKQILPDILKAAATSQTDVGEILQIAIKSKDFGLKKEDLPNILNMAAAGGRAGGFNLKNMARWMPKQMNSARERYGMGGKEDFATLIALNQAANKTAATEDEAGMNVEALLRAMNSENTAKALAKSTNKNMRNYMQERRLKGVSSIEAFGELVEESIARNPRYRALQAKLAASENDDDRRKALEDMTTVAENSSIGQIIPERKAMMALIAMLNNKEEMNAVKKAVLDNDRAKGGIIDNEMETLSDTFAFKKNLASENKGAGEREAMQGVLDKGGNILDAFNKFSEANSGFVGGLSIATTSLSAFAGAVGIATLAMGGGPGGVMKMARNGLGTIRAGAGSVTQGAGRIWATRGMSSLAVRGTSSLAGSVAAAGGIGTAAPAVAAAAVIGYEIGEKVVAPYIDQFIKEQTGDEHATLGTWLYDWWNKDKNKEIEQMLAPTPLQKQDVDVGVKADINIALAPGLVVQRQKMEVKGDGHVSMPTGNLNTGAL